MDDMPDDDELPFLPIEEPDLPERYPVDAMFDGILKMISVIENSPSEQAQKLALFVAQRATLSAFPVSSQGAGLTTVH